MTHRRRPAAQLGPAARTHRTGTLRRSLSSGGRRAAVAALVLPSLAVGILRRSATATATARRGAAAAVVLAGLAVAGCASSVAGTGTFAGAAPTSAGPTGGGLDNSTATPSTSLPTNTPTQTQTGGLPPGSDVRHLCDVLSPTDLRAIFGGMPHLETVNGRACRYTAPSGTTSVLIDEFDALTVAEDKQQKGGTDTTIAGHPAVLLDDGGIAVAETDSINNDGEVYAFVTKDSAEQTLAKKLLAKIVPVFAH